MKRLMILLGLGLSISALAQMEVSIADLQAPGIFGPDSAGLCGSAVIVTGVCVESTITNWGSRSSFHLADPAGGDYGGVRVSASQPHAFQLAPGDALRITGIAAEYHSSADGRQSNMTELVVVDPDADLELLGHEQPLPDPVVMDLWLLDAATHEAHLAEPLEGRVVEIREVTVVAVNPSDWRQFTVMDAAGHAAEIRLLADQFNSTDTPTVGATFASIRGVVLHAFGRYHLLPRDSADFEGLNGLAPATRAPGFAISSIQPNPANPGTIVEIQLDAPRQIRLTVINVKGQIVANLQEAWLPAGRQRFSLNAGDLPSGLYLCRLEANGQVQCRKLLVVK